MPLVRITQHNVRTATQTTQLTDIVQDVMLELFDAPPGDRYQIVETLPAGSIIAEDTGLGIERSDGVVIIQITQQGRDAQQKQRIYAALAERLAAADLVRPARKSGVSGKDVGSGECRTAEKGRSRERSI